MYPVRHENLCLGETRDTVTSISTTIHVPQPIEEKAHFIQNRIFVGGFQRDTNLKQLSSTFQPYGEVIETNIVRCADEGNKCYGFVTFHPRDAGAVEFVLLEYSRGKIFYLNGRPLVISRAAFRPKKVVSDKCRVSPVPFNRVSPVPFNNVVVQPKSNDSVPAMVIQRVYPNGFLSGFKDMKLQPLQNCSMQSQGIFSKHTISSNLVLHNKSNWLNGPGFYLQ